MTRSGRSVVHAARSAGPRWRPLTSPNIAGSQRCSRSSRTKGYRSNTSPVAACSEGVGPTHLVGRGRLPRSGSRTSRTNSAPARSNASASGNMGNRWPWAGQQGGQGDTNGDVTSDGYHGRSASCSWRDARAAAVATASSITSGAPFGNSVCRSVV